MANIEHYCQRIQTILKEHGKFKQFLQVVQNSCFS
ncbi:MAG: hypothetical protein RLZZ507_2605 [Cyanobacteriota bacterium]|jgi:hypothetical protein